MKLPRFSVSPRSILGVAFFLSLTGFGAEAQVLVERAPVKLSYRIFLDKGTTPIGRADVSFELTGEGETRRLQVVSHEVFELPGATAKSSPLPIDEKITMICDRKGVEQFDAVTKTGDTERSHRAVRKGIDFVITSQLGKKTVEKTITAGVQTTIQGLYCTAFLGRSLHSGQMFEDFPLLYPNVADHRAGQLVREGSFPVSFPGGESVQAFCFWVKRLDKKTDKFWVSEDGDQVLLRKEMWIDRGMLAYEIETMNGTPYPPKSAK